MFEHLGLKQHPWDWQRRLQPSFIVVSDGSWGIRQDSGLKAQDLLRCWCSRPWETWSPWLAYSAGIPPGRLFTVLKYEWYGASLAPKQICGDGLQAETCSVRSGRPSLGRDAVRQTLVALCPRSVPVCRQPQAQIQTFLVAAEHEIQLLVFNLKNNLLLSQPKGFFCGCNRDHITGPFFVCTVSFHLCFKNFIQFYFTATSSETRAMLWRRGKRVFCFSPCVLMSGVSLHWCWLWKQLFIDVFVSFRPVQSGHQRFSLSNSFLVGVMEERGRNRELYGLFPSACFGNCGPQWLCRKLIIVH